MDIAYGGTSALEVIRGVRRNQGLRLEPVEDVDKSAFASARGGMGPVNFLATGLAEPPSKTRPVTVRVPDARHRKQAQAMHSLVFPKGLGSPSLLQLKYTTPGPDKGLPVNDSDLFDGRHVYVDCVALACLTVAASYQRFIRAGRMGESDAVVRLVELVMEFTGHYGRDPADPLGGDIIEDLMPVTSVAQIQSFLDACKRIQGSGLLRKALRYARDGSRSAMETCLWIVLTMPASYGLFEFSCAKLNVQLAPTKAQRQVMRHYSLTPDIQWTEMAVAVEYQGLEPHSGKAAHAEDNRRMNDYQVCG